MDKDKFLGKGRKKSIEMLTPEELDEKEYRDFEKKEARLAARRREHEKHMQKLAEDGKVIFINRNEYIYQYPYGIEVSFPTGKYYVPATPQDRPKRGKISAFSQKSRRRCRKALISLDLPNGATRYAVTFTLPWIEEDWGGEVLTDFKHAVETFRTAFARCFNRCAMIYCVEPQKKRGAPHIHAMFYAPKDYDWATAAYSYFAKMRKRKRQKVVDSGGKMPPCPDKGNTTNFLHTVFSLLWFNAICRRTFPKSELPDYWKIGVKVGVYSDDADTIQISKTIHYMTKDDATSWKMGIKQWGIVQRKNLIEKKEIVEIHDRVRVLVLRDISKCKRNIFWYGGEKRFLFTERHSRRRNPVGIIVGITKDTMDKLIVQAEQNVRDRKMRYIMPRMIKVPMSPEGKQAMQQYLSMPDPSLDGRYE